MRTLSLVLSLFIITSPVFGQENQTIDVRSKATVKVPADRIVFNIKINSEADKPQKAFELQKKQEQMLIDLLKKHQIDEKNIQFHPISITKINRHKEDAEPKIQTSQDVSLTLSDFDKYEQIQLSLVDKGFDEFNGHFISSKLEKARDEALVKAMEQARSKAELIAKQGNLTLDGIKNINVTSNNNPRPVLQNNYASASLKTDSMISEYEQTVSISSSVNLQYYFTNN